MENAESIVNTGRNLLGPRKLEAMIKNGPVVQRAVLGNVANRPAQNLRSNLPLKNQQINLSKKPFTKSLAQKVLGKENVSIISKKSDVKEEKMDTDSVDNLSTAFSLQLFDVRDIDEADSNNPQLVSSYVKDIYKYLWEIEDKYPVKPAFLTGQKINSSMRGILIDWLIRVHLRFTLLPETLYLTVSIIDRYLQVKKTITKDKLQLVGVSAMYIASKYEEMYIPEIGDFVYITDNAYSKLEIRLMEIDILTNLGFFIGYPLQLHFLRRNSKAGEVDSSDHNLAKYFMELTLAEYSFSHFKASQIAAAALYLSLKLLKSGNGWDTVLSYYSSYSETQIIPVANKIAALVIKSVGSKYQAVREKYKSPKLFKISLLPQLSADSPLLKKMASRAAI